MSGTSFPSALTNIPATGEDNMLGLTFAQVTPPAIPVPIMHVTTSLPPTLIHNPYAVFPTQANMPTLNPVTAVGHYAPCPQAQPAMANANELARAITALLDALEPSPGHTGQTLQPSTLIPTGEGRISPLDLGPRRLKNFHVCENGIIKKQGLYWYDDPNVQEEADMEGYDGDVEDELD
ncbi:hypothetical protein CALVIDRAFT_564930 [Calocera viscosa TUFC12733]|uniref:Uncharacterized protein n=1 Tax=Calocera viscosa (strain TUFC12733) TaxID=1330018 RepID=A0A167KYI7_CALVF|nr:hypothetical protein CALVIDRAFT_564930 [Calocera viscosa TUFC12733]